MHYVPMRGKLELYCYNIQFAISMLGIMFGVYKHDWFVMVIAIFLYADIRVDDLCRSFEKRRET